MTLYIKLEHDNTGDSMVIMNGSVDNGITVLADGSVIGAPVSKPQISRNLDSLGVFVTGDTREPREVSLNLLVEATTQAGVLSILNELTQLAENVSRKGGGTLYYRSSTGDNFTRFKVGYCDVKGFGKLEEFEAFCTQRVTLQMICDPLGLTSVMDIYDPFTTDTLGTGGIYNVAGSDWSLAYGSAASISGGVMTTPAANGGYLHTGTPHLHGDSQVTVKAKWNTIASLKYASLYLKYVDPNNFIEVNAYSDGAGAGTLEANIWVGGVSGGTASTAITTLSASTNYWVRGRVEGNVVYVEWFTTEPTPTSTPTHSTSVTMSTAAAAALGSGVPGMSGLKWLAPSGTMTFDDFRMEAYTYRNLSLPAVIRMNGEIPGTTDARAGVSITQASGGTPIHSLLIGWWKKPDPHNYIFNHGAEVYTSGSSSQATGWVATAVSGVTNAATSVVRTTTSTAVRTGLAGFECVTPATVSSGPSFAIYRIGGFKKGVTYTFSAYVKSSGGSTTGLGMRLGVSGSISDSAYTALTTSWSQRTSTWTPTADTHIAYVAFATATATATTFQFDDVLVYEGTTAPTFEHGGFGPGIVPISRGTNVMDGDGGAFSNTVSAGYLIGEGYTTSGSVTNTGNLVVPLLPHLFVADDFTNGEVDIAVFGRIYTDSTIVYPTVTLKLQPETSSFGSTKYSEFGTAGKPITQSSNSYFRTVYLGTVTARVDKRNPTRMKLKLAYSNNSTSTGVTGFDYLVLVPAKNMAVTRTGVPSTTPAMFQSSSEMTKVIDSDLSVMSYDPGSTVTKQGYPDGSLLLNRIMLPNSNCEMVVIPSSTPIDQSDSIAASNALTHTATVQVQVQPQVHLLDS